MTWKTAKIGEVCTIEKGNIGIMKAVPGKFPLVVLGAERKTHAKFQFDDEAVIVPLVSSTGHGHRSMKRIFFQSGKFSIGSILCAVIPKDKTQLSAEFLFRYLDYNKEKELVSRMKGMANVSLPMKEIASVEIPLPPLEHQKRLIEEFQKLETANHKISTELSRQLEWVRQLRQAFLREAMQGELAAQNPSDEPAGVLLARIQAEKDKLIAQKKIKRAKPLLAIAAEEIPFEIPSNWVWCRLGEISEMCLGKMLDQVKNKGVLQPYLRNVNVRWGSFDLSDLKQMKFTEDEDERFSVINGDLVICEGGEPGRAAIWKSDEPIKIQKALHRVRTNKAILDSNYFYYCLCCDAVSKRLNECFTGGGIQHFTGKALSKYVIPLPPLSEQVRIVAKLETLMAFCDGLETSIRESAQHAESLLQVALKEALSPPRGD